MSRKRKNSSGVDDSGDDPASGGGRHVPQRQIPPILNRSQDRGASEVDRNERREQAEKPAVE